ncbi:MAG: C10 family peptidase, partial [Candidatus Aminicenantales bacterium]
MKMQKYGRTAEIALFAALSLLTLLNGALQARLVGPAEARSVSLRLLEMENARPDLRLTAGAFQLVGLEPLIYEGRGIAYLIRLSPGGFMILSDITESAPQVFVSFKGDPAMLPKHPVLREILNRLEYTKVHLGYLAARVSAAPGREIGDTPDAIQVNRNERAWAFLGRERIPRGDIVTGFAKAAAVAPLTTSRWSQDEPYSNYTPRIDGTPTPTGCSATASAQVMYFWKYPAEGQGSHSYQWNGQTLYADFNHPYYWGRMLDNYSGAYAAEQADAVARLMSDIGISIDMDYAVDGSGAYPNFHNSFFKFFKYSSDVHEVSRAEAGNWEAWFEIVKAQLDVHQLPILSIYTEDSGHAVVADGYRTSPGNQVHINMGWGGYADNYYSLDNIYGFGSAESDYAVVDIHPMQIKLTVAATAGGTTTPAPGVYHYPFGSTQTVRVTAFPQPHYAFLMWSGDASGSMNPIDVVVDMERRVKAHFQRNIYAPLNPAGEKIINRSFSQAENINRITFEANPDNIDIRYYKVVLVVGEERTVLKNIYGDDLVCEHHAAASGAPWI